MLPDGRDGRAEPPHRVAPGLSEHVPVEVLGQPHGAVADLVADVADVLTLADEQADVGVP